MANKKQKREERRERFNAKAAAGNRQIGNYSVFDLPGGVETLKLEIGKVKKISVVPFVAGPKNLTKSARGKLHFDAQYYVHKNVGPNKTNIVCPRQMESGRCAICDAVQEMRENPDADENTIKDLKAKLRTAMIVIDHDDDEPKLRLFDTAYFKSFGQNLDEYLKTIDPDDEEEGYIAYFADPDEGAIIKLRVTEGSYSGRKFPEINTFSFMPRTKPLPSDLVEGAPCLDECLRVPNYAETEIALYGEETKKKGKGRKDEDEEDDDDEDEEDDVPAPKAKSKKPASRTDDDDEDDDDDEPPVRSKSKSKKPVDDEDDEDDDDEDDDDDDDDDPVDVKKRGASSRSAAPSKSKKKPVDDDDSDDDEDDSDDDEDDDEDDEPAPKAKSKPKAKTPSPKSKKKPVDDEDDEDEDDDDDSDDEDDVRSVAKSKAKPKPKAKAPAKKKPVDDDDDDDDEDEEPAPKSKSKAASSPKSKGKPAAKPKGKSKPVDDDDDDDDDLPF